MMEPCDYTVLASDGVRITLHRLNGVDAARPISGAGSGRSTGDASPLARLRQADSGGEPANDPVAGAAARAGSGSAPAARWPLLMVAGTFSSRAFWFGTRGQGFARALAAEGHDVWVLEPRGHGTSERPHAWTLDDWILRDAPAAAERVLEETGAERFIWVGHSAGGVVGAAFAGAGHPASASLGGLVFLGSPGPGGLRGLRRIGASVVWAAAVLAPRMHVPGGVFGLGPEREPATLVRQWMEWNLDAAWRDERGREYLARLADVDVPLLAIAGTADRLLAPPYAVRDLVRRFGSTDATVVVAGSETGFAHDYDHPGLVVGRAAREEIWPIVADWLRQRVSTGTGAAATADGLTGTAPTLATENSSGTGSGVMEGVAYGE